MELEGNSTNVLENFKPKIDHYLSIIKHKQRSTLIACENAPNFSMEILSNTSYSKSTAMHIPLRCKHDNRIHGRNDATLITNIPFLRLEEEGVINWTRCTKSVIPLVVPDDGRSSLCHSISVQIFGIPDKFLFLRNCLRNTCKMHFQTSSPLHTKFVEYMKKEMTETEKVCCDDDFEQDWIKLCKATSTDERNDSNDLKSRKPLLIILFHVYILSQISKRMIIIVGLREEGFRSCVFLPDMIPKELREKCPIYLGYYRGTFAPLVIVNEPSTDENIRDNAIPISDCHSHLFKFFCLNENVEPLTAVKNFARDTTIGFTTDKEFKEIPAIRYPVTQCSEESFDNNSVIGICFKAYCTTNSPRDLYTMWKYVVFNETYTSNSFKQLSITAEDDIESDETGEHSCTNYGINDNNDVERKREETFHGLLYDKRNTTPKLSRLEFPKEKTVSLPDSNYTISRPTCSLSRSSLFGYGNEEELQPINNESELLSVVDDEIANDFVSRYKVQNFDLLNDIGPCSSKHTTVKVVQGSTHGQDAATIPPEHFNYFDDDINGAMIKLVSSHHAIVHNPAEITFTSVLLKLKDEIQVRIELFKNDDDHDHDGNETTSRTRLQIEKVLNLQVNYYRVFSNSSIIFKLGKCDRNYELKVVLPNFIIVEDQHKMVKSASSFWSPDDSSGESPFVDVQTHQQKCKTGGCIGIGVRSYRGLCAPCNKSWVEFLKRDSNRESDYDFFSSIESIDNKCRNRNCENTGESQFYGFCHHCFNAPGL